VLVSLSCKDAKQRGVRGFSQSIPTPRKQSGRRSLAPVSGNLFSQLGASTNVSEAEFVNPLDLPEGKNITEYLIEETDGGLDFTFDATGNVCTGSLPLKGIPQR
jgi:hypothetical protein